MTASIENEGKLAPLSLIRTRNTSENNCFICVRLRNRWQWQPINKISAQTFKKYKQNIISLSTSGLESLNVASEKTRNLQLSGLHGPNKEPLEGIFTPVGNANDNEFQIYKHGNYWLYPVANIWWIGTLPNKDRRRAWGFMRELVRGPQQQNAELKKPWEVSEWRYWDPTIHNAQNTIPAGSWIDSDVVKFKLIAGTENNLKAKYKKMEQELAGTYSRHIEELERQTIVVNKKLEIHKTITTALYNNLSEERRKEISNTSNFRRLFKTEKLCSICLSAKKIKKCIHIDCVGACNECHSENEDEKCRACGKDQKLECPICTEVFQPSFMNIFGCKHAVCWKCSCKAHECKKPLKKCPMCRKPI
jgi:hypothetical protein